MNTKNEAALDRLGQIEKRIEGGWRLLEDLEWLVLQARTAIEERIKNEDK